MGVGQNAVIYLTLGGLQTLGTKYFGISLVVTTTTKKFLDLEAQNLWGQTMLEILIQKEAKRLFFNSFFLVSPLQSSVKRIVRLVR